MVIGINCIKDQVIIAEGSGDGPAFQLGGIKRLAFSINHARDLSDLFKNIKSLISGYKTSSGDCIAAIVSCSAGSWGSDIESIKAEAIVELVCDSIGIDVAYIKPQSFKPVLGCTGGEKWQDKAKALFNSAGTHKYFSNGGDKAAIAAFWRATST